MEKLVLPENLVRKDTPANPEQKVKKVNVAMMAK